MDLDRQWRIRDTLAGSLATAYGRHGTTARDQEVLIDVNAGGKVTLRRPTVGHETVRGQSEEGRWITVAVDQEDEVRSAAAATRFADMHMALQDRERRLTSLDIGYEQVPPWSVVGDALLVHVARRAGWDMAELCRPTLSGGSCVAGENGFELSAPDQFAVRANDRTYMATMLRGWLSGGVIGHPFKIRCGADGATTYDGTRRPVIAIMDQRLPESLLLAARGRLLDEIVGHPVLEGSGCRVTSVANIPGNVDKLEIRLRRSRVPLADPPAGVDTSWLDTIARLSS